MAGFVKAGLGVSRKHWVSLASIFFVNLMVYNIALVNPYLFSDDWWYTKMGAWNEFSCLSWNFFRPFLFCWPELVDKLFGTNPAGFHLMNLLTNILMGVFLYVILCYFWDKSLVYATTCSILFSVLPSDLSHTWYTISGIRFAFILFLLSIIFLLLFLRSDKWGYYIVSVVILVPTFFIYEYHLGLAFLTPLLLLFRERHKRTDIRLALIGVAFIPVLFAVWRAFGQNAAGIADAGVYSVDTSGFSIPDIIERLIIGYRVLFQWSWTETILHLPFFQNLTGPRNIVAMGIFVIWEMLFIIFAWILHRVAQRRINGRTNNEWMKEIRAPIIGFGIGLLVVGFGYFPIVTVWGPWMGFYISRMNILPGIGAALAISAFVELLALMIHQGRQGAYKTFVLINIPFLTLGFVAQVMINYGAEQAWVEQKQIWNQVFTLAPGLAPHTSIYLIMEPKEEVDIFKPLPFSDGNSGLGFSSALSLFYNDDRLKAVAINQIPQQPTFSSTGIQRPWGIDLYRQIVFLKYDRVDKKLIILPEFPDEILEGNTPAEYRPQSQITTTINEDGLAKRELVK